MFAGWVGMLLGAVMAPDNGAVVFARPLEVVVDGRLDEWPSDGEARGIALGFQESADQPADYAATLRVAYHPSRPLLFVAVEVTDDVTVLEGSEQDRHALYVDRTHSPDGSAPAMWWANESARGMGGPAWSWDPAVASASWDDAELVITRDGARAVYEWSVALDEPCTTGTVFGLDYTVDDVDTVGGTSSQFAFGDISDKAFASFRCGDVVCVDAVGVLGEATGRVAWAERPPKPTPLPSLVRWTSTTDPGCWTQSSISTSGRYRVRLPEGAYRVTLHDQVVGEGDSMRRIDAEPVEVVVEAGTRIEAPVLQLHVVDPPMVPHEEGVLLLWDDSERASLDGFVEACMSHYRIPGVSLALVAEGEMVAHRTYGVANQLTRAPVTSDTLFEAASITKAVFSFAACRLIERGVLELDQPLWETLPFPEIAYDPRARTITPRHVLAHQTGFPNWAYMNPDGRLDLKFDPGTQFGYSGEGFEYLGRAAATLCAKTLSDVLRDEVVEPLGLGPNFCFCDRDGLADQLAVGHRENRPQAQDVPEAPGVAHSLMTEAKAFTRFMIALLDEEGLAAETYEEWFTPQMEVPRSDDLDRWDQDIGLGLFLSHSPEGLMLEHGGNNGDFQCHFEVYHEVGVGFVVFANNDHGADLQRLLSQYLITGAQSG